MNTSTLNPIDGRYYNEEIEHLKDYFSEQGSIVNKTKIEVKYTEKILKTLDSFNLLKDREGLDEFIFKILNIPASLTYEENFADYKKIEQTTKHDIKAIEYYIREKTPEYKKFHNYIHFGLTSQDINSPALSSSLHWYKEYLVEYITQFNSQIFKFGKNLQNIVIPARTHGQMAVPTRFGKEIFVYWNRINTLVQKLKNHQFSCKLGGACGNLSAHYAAHPDIPWIRILNEFAEQELHVSRNLVTTQVDNNASIAEFFQILTNISLALIDFCRDIWMYYSYKYLSKKSTKGSIGSSTMPQKSNPIEFENAEGNLEFAVNLFNFFVNKLQISRLQRDLTDSTVTRNIGMSLGYFMISLESVQKGLKATKCTDANLKIIARDLEENYDMGSEWLQTVMRSKGLDNPYEKVKQIVDRCLTKQEFDLYCQELIGQKFNASEYSDNREVEKLVDKCENKKYVEHVRCC